MNGDFVTNHGFGGIGGGTDWREIAKRVAGLPGVLKTIVVNGEKYKVMFQFNSKKHPGGLDGLKKDITGIPGVRIVDFFVGCDEFWYDGLEPDAGLRKKDHNKVPMP